MKTSPLWPLVLGLALSLTGVNASASDLSPELKAKVDAKAKQFGWLSTDAKVVAAVKEHNTAPPADVKAMTNDKWKALNILDPFVRGLSKNPLAEYLKTKKDASIAELFVSGADGGKVALFNKTTSWTHQGKDQHEVPMKGKTYVGPPELDQSSGVETVCGLATGGWLTELTVIETVAGGLVTVPSLTVKVKLSGPA